MFFNNKHSLGTPRISTEGTVIGGIERPPPGNPPSAGTEACTRGLTMGGTDGAAPRIGPVGKARPGLLTTGLPSEPATLQ